LVSWDSEALRIPATVYAQTLAVSFSRTDTQIKDNLRIGLPNILPLIGFLFFGAVGVLMTILFFDKVDTAETGATIFFVIFILFSYGMFGLLCFRFKVVVMTVNKLVIIFPFRLKLHSITYDKIDDLKWDLWGTFRMGDYRKLIIRTQSGYRTNISDLEFINYDSLEKWLMERTKLEFNLDRKTYVEVQQAKYNKWVNMVAILMVGFFTFLISNGRNDNNIRTVILLILVLIIWRLCVRLVQYQQRIKVSRQRREDWRKKTNR
jgi:hypothetical protein